MPAVAHSFDRVIARWGVAATLYESDGVSNPRSITLMVSNGRTIPLVNARGDVFAGHAPSTVALLPGQVVNLPSLPAGWFLVIKQLQLTKGLVFDPGTSVALLALPLLLTVSGKVTATPASRYLNARDEPRYVDAQGRPGGITTETGQIHAGLSNQLDVLTEDTEGALPAGLTTLYCPLSSGVGEDDPLQLPDGTTGKVVRAQELAADGQPYALQLLVGGSVGTGLS